MRGADWLGILAGVIAGLICLAVLGCFGPSPCTSMALVFDDASKSPLLNQWLGFECDRWPGLVEGLAVEWVPAILVFSLSGALATRIGESSSPRNGIATGAVIAGLAFLMRTESMSIGFFQQLSIARMAIFFPLSVFLGFLAGWAGGNFAKRNTLQ